MNLFLIPLDLERRWYRFHHLFADYLRTLLDPAEERALRERAADYLESAGLLEEAIDQAVAAGSIERAIRLLERQAAGRTSRASSRRCSAGSTPCRATGSPRARSWSTCGPSRCFFVGRVEDAARTCDEGEAACPCDARVGPLLTACALIAAFSNRPDAAELGRAAVRCHRRRPVPPRSRAPGARDRLPRRRRARVGRRDRAVAPSTLKRAPVDRRSSSPRRRRL